MADDIIKTALEQFRESQDGSDYNRVAAQDDIRFARMSDQWPRKVREQRVEEGRPCLTINKLPSFIRQVVNDARQNKPGIGVHPVDSGADVATAEVIGGLVRSIERGSNAEIAYDTAIDHAVTGGFGFFRIGIDYAHDDTFDMECQIQRVPNPLMVHWDISSTEFDASDWAYAFVSDFLSEDQFRARYPKADPVSWEGGLNEDAVNWTEESKLRLAEYWLRTEESRNLIMLSNGDTVREDMLPKMAAEFFAAGAFELGGMVDDEQLVRNFLSAAGLQQRAIREVRAHKVKRRIINGQEVLEEEDWPGSAIPICPVWGDEVIIDGKRHFLSMIRDAKDPQTMFNFWRSATTELVALAPRAPWLIEEGAIPKGQQGVWQTANTRSHAYLPYAKGHNMPKRETFAGVPAGALQESLNANDDMKSILGIYDASLGARSNETSGRAILARQRESDVSNFHFIDNLNRAIRYAGRCLVDIIPAVYSTRSSIRILGEDMKDKVARLAGENPDAEGGLYNLAVGKYDVTVRSGPSYSTQREETRETLIEIMRAVPDAAALLGDVLLDHMDFVGADKVSKRLQLLLPLQIQQAEGIAPPPQTQQAGGIAPPQPMPAEPGMPGPAPQNAGLFGGGPDEEAPL